MVGHLPFPLLLLFLPLGASAQQPWIVDRSGAGQFLEIQPAVDAAHAGDRIEVRGDSAYLGFELTKGLDIEAVGASTVEWFVVRDLPVDQRARLTGLHVVGGGQAPTSGAVARADRCLGSVQFEGLRVDAPDDHGGLNVSRCAAVLLRGCTAVGGAQTVFPGAAGVGLQASMSGVALEGSSITGGPGRDASGSDFATPGASALVLSGGSVTVAQSTLLGGTGGSGGVQGGIGGTGISTAGAMVVLTGGSQLRGGPSGVPIMPGFPTGSAVFLNPFNPGRVRVGIDCTVVGASQGAEPVPVMAALHGDQSVAPGGRADVVLSGEPVTLAVLFADVALAHLAIPGVDGPMLLRPAAALFLGTWVVPASRSVSIPFEVPGDPTLLGADVFLQGVGVEAARDLYFTDLGGFRIR